MFRILLIQLFIILGAFSCFAQDTNAGLNQNHLIGTHAVSLYGGITAKGEEFSGGVTAYPKSLNGFAKSLYLSYGTGKINKATGTSYNVMALKMFMEKSVKQYNSFFLNAGVGPFLSFEELKSTSLSQTHRNNFVPGLTGYLEAEYYFNSNSRWGVFGRFEQTLRFRSDIGSLYFSANLGVRYAIP